MYTCKNNFTFQYNNSYIIQFKSNFINMSISVSKCVSSDDCAISFAYLSVYCV